MAKMERNENELKLCFRVKIYTKKTWQCFNLCDLLLNEKQKKPFVCFLFNNRSHKALPSFLHMFLLENEAQTSKKKNKTKKNRAVTFYNM